MFGEDARVFVLTMKWLLGIVVGLLVLLLGWLTLSAPTVNAHNQDPTIHCRPILGPMRDVKLSGMDTREQETAVNSWVSKLWSRDSDYLERETVLARLHLGRACQDARMGRQTGVNMTLAALVMLLGPVGLHRAVKMRDHARASSNEKPSQDSPQH